MDPPPDKCRTVFVVYGRNSDARRELFAFLRALHLHPLEWEQARKLTGKSTPYVGEILAAGFNAAQAAVVLLTPDDEARLREPYRHQGDGDDETQLTGQPRQNVIFEAGMAMGLYEDRTIIVELGKLRPMSDVVGRHVIRLNDSPETRNDLVHRLRGAGCDVDSAGRDWYSTGKFNETLAAINNISPTETKSAPASDRDDSASASLLSDDEKSYIMEIRRPRNVRAFSIALMNSSGCEIRYLEMMEHFVGMGLVRQQSDVFSLTTKGQRVADFLWRHRILSALLQMGGSVASTYNLVQTVELMDGDAEIKEFDRHIQALQDARKIDVVKGCAQITELGLAALGKTG
jgi:hypothetical protein